MSEYNSPSSLSQVEPGTPSDGSPILSDGPIRLALASSVLVFAAAMAGCLIVSEGFMPLGHVVYLSILIAGLAGSGGLLVVGVASALQPWLQNLQITTARRSTRTDVPAGAQLAMK